MKTKLLLIFCWAFLIAAITGGVWALATATPPHLIICECAK